MSFSQVGEDKVIEKIVAGTTGRYLDIGAYRPEALSNTRALFEAGWRGVLVDVSPAAIRALAAAYGSGDAVQVIQAGIVTDSRRFATVMATDDAVSTIDPAIYKKWVHAAEFYGKYTAAAVTLPELFAEVGNDFEVVSIDVEGGSVDVLKALIPALGRRPLCVVVEHDDRFEEVDEWASKNGYSVAAKNGINYVLKRE